jgi:hypothetical protein
MKTHKKIRGIVFVLFLFNCIQLSNAQYECGNTEPEPLNLNNNNNCFRVLPQNNADANLLMTTYIPDSSTAIITIPINLNIWRTDEGAGNYWENTPAFKDSLRKVIGFLNWIFSDNDLPSDPITGAKFIPDTKVRFVIDSFYYYNNTLLCYDDNSSRLTAYLIANYPERMDKFNYHLTINTTASYSGISSGYNATYHSICSVKQNVKKNLWALAIHMAHEFGHNFGLHHPYNSEYRQISHPEFLWDLFGTETQSWCNAPAGMVCYHDAGWGTNPFDPSNTSTNNIMGGTKDASHFTALQCGRIHRALAVSTLRSYAYGYSHIPLTITSNMTFDVRRKFYQNVVVDSGVTLTVTCGLEFVDSARLIVRRGGKLIVDGGELTSAGNVMWKGVVVEGNADSARLERCQGTVILQNGATISNAICGINIQGGGIIKATNAYFTNNSQGVVMQEYNHAQVVSSHLPIRKTYFRNCSFNVNNNAFFANSGTFTHVSLTGIQDAAFVSCSFTDTRSNLYFNLLGIGIASYTSSLDMDDNHINLQTPVRNYFSGLGTGILLQSSYENTSRIQCCHFANNSAGIHAVNSDYLICRDNIFEIEHPIYGVAGNTHGIILAGCTQYTVMNNLFSGEDTYSIGISIDNSGIHNNLIKNNTFEDLYIGCYVTGCNGGNGDESIFDVKGLEFLCNSFTNQGICDIFIDGNATIHSYQGALWKGAGNYFTTPMNIVNMNSKVIQYYYDQNETGHMPNIYGPVLLCSTQGNDCGSYGYSDGYTYTESVSLTTLEQQYSAANSEYQTVAANYGNSYGYLIPTVLDDEQASALADLLDGQWLLTNICNAAIYKITSDSVFDVTLYETWLERAETVGCVNALMESYYHHNMVAYNNYRNTLLSRNQNTSENNNLVRLFDLRHAVGNSDLGWRNLDTASVSIIRRIAENRDRSGLLARTILSAFYGETYRYDSLHPLFPIIRCGNNDYDLPPMESSSPMADGVEKIQDKDMILVVQPNPAKDVINVTIEGAMLSSVILYDMQGRIVWRKENVGNNVIIPCAKIGKGVYFLSAIANEKQYTRKIIVE